MEKKRLDFLFWCPFSAGDDVIWLSLVVERDCWGARGDIDDEFDECLWWFVLRGCNLDCDCFDEGWLGWFLLGRSLSNCDESIHGKQENNLRNSELNFA